MTKPDAILRASLSLMHLASLIKSSAFKDNCKDVHLFGSKTAYSEHLAACLAKDNELFDVQSLEERHKELVNKQGCKPVALYLIGRHAARQPSLEDIEQIVGNLEGKFDEDSEFSRWQWPFSLERAGLVTTLGASNHRGLARRLARVYPQFFDANNANIELATTSKLRTLQTGIEFLKEVAKFRVKVDENSNAMCGLKNSPDDFECGGRATEQDLKCLESILPQYSQIHLEFHKIYKRKIKQMECNIDKKLAPKQLDKERSKVLSKIASIKWTVLNEVAAKIKKKLSLKVAPSAETVSRAYEAFAYETSALFGRPTKSIWHNLFDRKHLEALEYLEDAKIYHKMASNRDSFAIQSSPLFKDLLDKLIATVSSSDVKPRAYFSFTHVGLLKKFFAPLGLFDDDKQAGYSLAELEAFEKFRVLPKRRIWRASVMIPFSGNMQFALYKCPAGESSADQFKLLTSMAEWPIRVKGCPGSVCPLSDFLATYNPLRQYSYEQVCEHLRKLMGA